MTKKMNIVATVAPLAAAMGLVFAAGSAMAGTWVTDTQADKAVVTNAYGECWNAMGAAEKAVEKCGDKVAAAAPAVDPCSVDGDKDGVADCRDKCPNTRPGATVDKDGCEITDNVTIDLVSDEFDFDSDKLKPDMKAALTDFANKVKASPGHESITVVGHTDSVGTEAYNQGLSERRAKSAAKFLESQGLDSITTKGMGESQPVADNKTKAGRAKNRRVEITTH